MVNLNPLVLWNDFCDAVRGGDGGGGNGGPTATWICRLIALTVLGGAVYAMHFFLWPTVATRVGVFLNDTVWPKVDGPPNPCDTPSMITCPGRIGAGVDDTCLPDLALESLGGLVLRHSESAPPKVRVSFMGIPIVAAQAPPPETVIRYGVEPGNCWALKGSKGFVVLQIMKPAHITGFHLQHINKNLDPYGELGSAPREFQIWGHRAPGGCRGGGDRELLGNYTFCPKVNPLQYFEVQYKGEEMFGKIELDVLSNYGDDVTCIYRLRVHGVIKPPEKKPLP